MPSESIDWGYTSYNNFTTTRGTVAVNTRSASYSKYSSDESYEDSGQNYSYNNNSYSSKTKVGRITDHAGFFLTFSFLPQSPGVTGGVGLASLK